MSLVPLLFDLLDDEPIYSFGLGYHQNDLFNPRHRRGHYLNMPTSQMLTQCANRRRNPQQPSALATQHVGKDGFQVNLDVQHFAPNEIKVKTVDGDILVEGEHEEKEDDHGHIYRRFVRRYTLPKEFDTKDVVSSLSSDGVLTIKAPPAAKAIESNERVVQIQQTGPAQFSEKQNAEADEKKMDE